MDGLDKCFLCGRIRQYSDLYRGCCADVVECYTRREDAMLIFGRREGERVVITTPHGDEIVVTILESRDGNVRLGFTAPMYITINREEVQREQEKRR